MNKGHWVQHPSAPPGGSDLGLYLKFGPLFFMLTYFSHTFVYGSCFVGAYVVIGMWHGDDRYVGVWCGGGAWYLPTRWVGDNVT